MRESDDGIGNLRSNFLERNPHQSKSEHQKKEASPKGTRNGAKVQVQDNWGENRREWEGSKWKTVLTFWKTSMRPKHSHGIFFRGCDGSDRHRETSSEGCYLAGKISTFYTVTTLKLHGKFYLI